MERKRERALALACVCVYVCVYISNPFISTVSPGHPFLMIYISWY